MINIPERVKVAGHYYTVIMMPADWCTQTGAHGQCDSTSLEIRVAENPLRQEETFIHELGHAVFYEWGLMHASDDEEAIVTLMMMGLYQVMVDNPGVFSRP